MYLQPRHGDRGGDTPDLLESHMDKHSPRVVGEPFSRKWPGGRPPVATITLPRNVAVFHHRTFHVLRPLFKLRRPPSIIKSRVRELYQYRHMDIRYAIANKEYTWTTAFEGQSHHLTAAAQLADGG